MLAFGGNQRGQKAAQRAEENTRKVQQHRNFGK
jgi:hypothetical protein